MTITLDVPADLAAQLIREADHQGMALDQFMLRAAVRQIGEPRENVPARDLYLAAAVVRNRAAADELQRLGISDSAGNLLRLELPEDMREGADRDFGG
jgi:hypothetical protein